MASLLIPLSLSLLIFSCFLDPQIWPTTTDCVIYARMIP